MTTWNELKEFCNSLNEEQLKHKVILWQEDSVIDDISAECLPEDQYIDLERDDEGCFPESLMNTFLKDNPEDYPNGKDDFKKVYDKGTPILLEEF